MRAEWVTVDMVFWQDAEPVDRVRCERSDENGKTTFSGDCIGSVAVFGGVRVGGPVEIEDYDFVWKTVCVVFFSKVYL